MQVEAPLLAAELRTNHVPGVLEAERGLEEIDVAHAPVAFPAPASIRPGHRSGNSVQRSGRHPGRRGFRHPRKVAFMGAPATSRSRRFSRHSGGGYPLKTARNQIVPQRDPQTSSGGGKEKCSHEQRKGTGPEEARPAAGARQGQRSPAAGSSAAAQAVQRELVTALGLEELLDYYRGWTWSSGSSGVGYLRLPVHPFPTLPYRGILTLERDGRSGCSPPPSTSLTFRPRRRCDHGRSGSTGSPPDPTISIPTAACARTCRGSGSCEVGGLSTWLPWPSSGSGRACTRSYSASGQDCSITNPPTSVCGAIPWTSTAGADLTNRTGPAAGPLIWLRQCPNGCGGSTKRNGDTSAR